MHCIGTNIIIGMSEELGYVSSDAGRLGEADLVRVMRFPHQHRFHCDSISAFAVAVAHKAAVCRIFLLEAVESVCSKIARCITLTKGIWDSGVINTKRGENAQFLPTVNGRVSLSSFL